MRVRTICANPRYVGLSGLCDGFYDGTAERIRAWDRESAARLDWGSLIELLIALAISSVAISAAIQAFSAYGLRLSSATWHDDHKSELRLGMDVLCSERFGGERAVGWRGPVSQSRRRRSRVLCQPEQFRDHPDPECRPRSAGCGGRRWDGLATGKQIVMCSAAHCAWNQLAAADGRKHTLTLATPPAGTVPGSECGVPTESRALLPQAPRGWNGPVDAEVDGGVSTLLSDVRGFRLRYFNRHGRETEDAREVVRVHVTIEMGMQRLTLSRDIAIRT